VASQAIFSDEVDILEEHQDLVHIQMKIDTVKGWVQKQSVQFVEQLPLHTVIVEQKAAHVYAEANVEKGPLMTLPFESHLTYIEELEEEERRWLKVQLPSGKLAYIERGCVSFKPRQLTKEEMVAFSKRFLGLPYTWGGRSSFGYDCSGFMQMLYRQMGIFLPRNSKKQCVWEGFRPIEIENISPGDLIFWGTIDQKINHVGMYIGDGQFIHTIASVEKKPYLRISHLNDPAWDGKASNYHAFRTARTLRDRSEADRK